MKWIAGSIVLIGWLFSSAVFAVDYYWYNHLQGNTVHYSSPEVACTGALTYFQSGLYPEASLKTPAYRSTDAKWYCQLYYYASKNESQVSTVSIYRMGESCPAGAQYNPSTGECVAPEPDQCASATGEFVHEYNAGSLDPSVPPSLPPSSICESGCLYNRTATVKGCNRFLETTTGKDLNSVYCQVVYQGAGSQCTTNNPPPGSVFDQPPSKPPADATPQYNTDNLCGEWVTNADGTQSRNCTSTETLKEPGQLNCDNAGAYLHCTTGKPAPRFEDTSKTEQTTKTNNPDGSSKTETSTTTDKTVCVGTKPCTSTTAEQTSTSGTNADGTAGDESSTCTGSGCTSDDSEEEGEDEEGPERAASAGSCDAAFSCSGDAIDCEVLRQQKEQLCHAEEMADFPKHKPAIEAAVSGDQFQLSEGAGVIDVPSFINQGTRFLPSTCPTAESFSLTTAGGRTFQLSYEPLCRAASDLSGLFVAVATVLAALYVGRAVGGQ